MNKVTLIIAAMVAAVSLAACEVETVAQAPRATEQKAATQNQQSLLTKYPVPKLNASLERANLIWRAQVLNQENLVGCITLFAGPTVVATFTVDGKVSSLKSYLLAGDQIVDDPNYKGSTAGWAGSLIVEQPDIDGAYGENADGIFFKEAETGAYVEWKGDYIYSDKCLYVSAQPVLTRAIEDKKPATK